MATYNGAKYIREQLDSLAKQTFIPCELVICDDGSTDDTLSIVHEFAKLAPFQVVIYQNDTNLGYGENFLHTASCCTGDWVAFCDQDDVWLPDKLETCRRYMINGVTMIYHSADVVDENLKPLTGYQFQAEKSKTIPCNTFLPWKSITGFTILFDAKLPFYKEYKNRPHDPHRISMQIAHDQWVPFLATIFGKIVFISRRLALYRQHGSNVMGALPLQAEISGKRIISRGGFSPEIYLELSKLASERSSFLSCLINQSDIKQANALKFACRRYTRQSQFLGRRYILYTDITSAHRAWLLAALLLRSGYGSSQSGGLGFRAFVKDGLNLIYKFCGRYSKI